MGTIEREGTGWRPLLIALLVCALLGGIYWTVRYGGLAMETDAAHQAASAGGILATGRLVTNRAYNNGYAYGAILAFISALAGIPVQSVQLASGLWMFLVIVTGFIAYRELLGDAAAAALATVLLLVQPDFMFYVLRGSHEKMTWTFALLMLFLLARSYRYSRSPLRLALYVSLFYLTFFTMATSNAYFASVFMTAIVISFVGGWAVTRLRRRGLVTASLREETLRRLMMIALIGSVIVFAFVAYVYPPALGYFWIVKTLFSRLGLLFATAEAAGPPASYSYFGTAWRSQPLYLLLTGVQWLVAGAGLLAWLRLAFSREEVDEKRRLVWLLYAGFAVQVGYGVLADFMHFLSDNMQLRLFTPLALFAAPMAASLIADLYRLLGRGWRRVITPAAALLAAYAIVVTLLKVTNDPYFGNQWLFYSPAELRAAQWIDDNLQERRIWVDTVDHLNNVFDFARGYSTPATNTYTFGQRITDSDYILLTTLTRLRAGRSGISLPSTVHDDQVYDNGVAQVYHPRQRTPYQR